MFEEIMAKNVPKMLKDVKPQIQKVQKTLRKKKRIIIIQTAENQI